jgi:hypothetical protein
VLTFGGPALIDSGAPYAAPAGLDTMSCPSTGLCVGDTGGFGEIVSSTNPGGSSASDWSQFPTAAIAGHTFNYSIGGVSQLRDPGFNPVLPCDRDRSGGPIFSRQRRVPPIE